MIGLLAGSSAVRSRSGQGFEESPQAAIGHVRGDRVRPTPVGPAVGDPVPIAADLVDLLD